MLIGAGFLLITGLDFQFDLRTANAIALLSISPPLREVLQFRANEKVDAGSLSVLLNLTTVVTVVFAALLLDDVLSLLEFGGTALIVVVAGLVARFASKEIKFSLLVFVVGAPLIFLDSASNLGEGWFIGEYSLSLYLFYGLAAQGFWAVVFMRNRRQSFANLVSSPNHKDLADYIVTRGIKGIIFLSAIDLLGSIATVKALVSVTPIAVTLAAYYWLGENEHLKAKLGAAALAASGLILFTV